MGATGRCMHTVAEHSQEMGGSGLAWQGVLGGPWRYLGLSAKRLFIVHSCRDSRRRVHCWWVLVSLP